MLKWHANNSFTLARGARWTVWLLVATATLCAASMHGIFQSRRSSAARQSDTALAARRQQLDAAAKAARDRVRDYMSQRRAEGEFSPTLAQLEQELNGGNSFPLHPRQTGGNQTSYLWNDPASGMEFRFTVDAHGHVGYSSNWPSGPVYPWKLPPPAKNGEAFESLRRAFIGAPFEFGPASIAWIVLFIACLFPSVYRPALTELLLALAVLCTAAWAVPLNHPLSLDGVLSNDMLFWGSIMLVVSGIAVALTRPRELVHQSSLCPKCGYDLRATPARCPECGAVPPWAVRGQP